MTLHLLVLQGNPDDPPKLAVEGRFGCDYAWNADYTAYRCLPHRWRPGSDESYAEYQAGYYDEYEPTECERGECEHFQCIEAERRANEDASDDDDDDCWF